MSLRNLNILLLILLFSQCEWHANIKVGKSELTDAQKTCAYYLLHNSLISDTFSRMVWKIPVDCRGIDLENKEAYFVFSENADKAKFMSTICIDTTNVEYAKCKKGTVCSIGSLEGLIDGYVLFRTPLKNLQVYDSIKIISKLEALNIPITLKDLNQYQVSNTYNTFKHFEIKDKVYAANIANYISLKGKDPIIKKLADQLTKNCSTTIQKRDSLHRFVTNKIEYSYQDFWYNSEITERAYEVLLSGNADCSGKTILLASLLQEYDIPYCLLYFKNHVTIGFPKEGAVSNNYIYSIQGKEYMLAEVTIKDFVIGKSILTEDEILDDLNFYCFPQKDENIYNAKTNKAVEKLNFKELQY